MKMFSLSLLLSLISSSLSYGAVNTSYPNARADYVQGQYNFRNYVTNPSCQKNTASIVTSGSATVTRNTTNPLEWDADCAVTLASNSADYVSYPARAIDRSLINSTCEGRFTYTSTSLGTKVTPIIYVGSTSYPGSVLASAAQPATSSTSYPCGSQAVAPLIRISNNPANSGSSALKVSDVYLGKQLPSYSSSSSSGVAMHQFSFGGAAYNTLCATGACTIYNSDGYVSSVSNSGTGVYVVTITGCSNRPVMNCTANQESFAVTNGKVQAIKCTSTTSCTVYVYSANGSALEDAAVGCSFSCSN